MTVSRAQAAALEECLARGGVAIFPADTVYGLCCDAENPAAVARLHALKGRSPAKPTAVMFFGVGQFLAALPELGARSAAAARALLPGPVTLVVPNPAARFPLAGPGDALGVRVPAGNLDLDRPVIQSSANPAGQPEARRAQDVDERLRAGVDLVIDGGELPGRSSTVIDLRTYEATGAWSIVRPGAFGAAALRQALEPRNGAS